MSEIVIKTETIRLSQLLKLANAVQDGVEAKFLIRDGVVKVNREVETRRGRKLKPGDMVEIHAATYKVTFKDNE